MNRCIGEPISWLLLERYGLGELAGSERAQVAQHLEACPACRACWAGIEADAERVLPPLAAGLPVGRVAGVRRRAVWGYAGALAAAAAALLVVWQDGGPGLEPPAATRTVKGGELSLELVRLGAAGQLREPTHYHPDDRFKLLLTCPPPWRGFAQIVVYQDGRAYFPLELERVEACGNRQSLAGALRLDGDAPVLVCVATAEKPIERAQLERGVRGLPKDSVCEALERDPVE